MRGRGRNRERGRDDGGHRHGARHKSPEKDVEEGPSRKRGRSHSHSPQRSRSGSPRRHRRHSRSRPRSRSHSPRRRRRHSRSRSNSHSRSRDRGRMHDRSRSRSRSPRERRRRKHSKERRRRSRSSSSSSSSPSDDSRHRRRKEKKRKHKEKKEKKKERKVCRYCGQFVNYTLMEWQQQKKSAAVGHQWGKYGIINETDLFNKEQEFRAWLVEERKINPETISKDQTKKEFAHFVEDYNTATLPHEKFYHMEAYERRMAALRSGEFVPPPDDAYDPNADMRALQSAHKRKTGERETYMSKEQLEELRKVQAERIQAGKMKRLGMDVKQTMGVRMDGTMFDG